MCSYRRSDFTLGSSITRTTSQTLQDTKCKEIIWNHLRALLKHTTQGWGEETYKYINKEMLKLRIQEDAIKEDAILMLSLLFKGLFKTFSVCAHFFCWIEFQKTLLCWLFLLQMQSLLLHTCCCSNGCEERIVSRTTEYHQTDKNWCILYFALCMTGLKDIFYFVLM